MQGDTLLELIVRASALGIRKRRVSVEELETPLAAEVCRHVGPEENRYVIMACSNHTVSRVAHAIEGGTERR